MVDIEFNLAGEIDFAPAADLPDTSDARLGRQAPPVGQRVFLHLARDRREAHRGNAYLSPLIAKRLRDQCRQAMEDGTSAGRRTDYLTTREAEVLQLLAQGRANKQIAADLCISIKTVEKHRQQVMNKLGIHDVAGLTRHAIAKGIIETHSGLRPMG